MSKPNHLRQMSRDLRSLWIDREARIKQAKAALHALPSRFQNAEPRQKHYLLGLGALILVGQILLILL